MTSPTDSKPAQSITPDRLNSDALQLYNSGLYDQAAAAFARLAAMPGHAAGGHYGIGMTQLARNDSVSAEQSFLAAIEADSGHAEAHTQLGRLRERAGDQKAAIEHYKRAASSNGAGSVTATERLRALGVRVPSADSASAPSVASDRGDGLVATAERFDLLGPHGVYGVLLSDKSDMSRETLAAIDDLTFDRSPRPIAFSKRWAMSAAVVLVAVFLLVHPLPDPHTWVGAEYQLDPALMQPMAGLLSLVTALALIAAVTVPIAAFVEVRAMRYVAARGRLQVRRGLIRRHLINIELWRIQDIELKRSPLNQLTRDGTLLFHISDQRNRRHIELTGLAQGPELEAIYQRFLNVVFLLRSSPAVKGIIY